MTVAELTSQVNETNLRLTEAIAGLRTEVAELRKDVGWVVKIGGTLVACMLVLLGFAYRVDQRAARTEDAVIALQANFAEFKTDFKARDKQIADSLDRIEKALAQAPSPKSSVK
jgi:hypothetical protein